MQFFAAEAMKKHGTQQNAGHHMVLPAVTICMRREDGRYNRRPRSLNKAGHRKNASRA